MSKKLQGGLLGFFFLLIFLLVPNEQARANQEMSILNLHSELLEERGSQDVIVLELLNKVTGEKQEVQVGKENVRLELKEGVYELREISTPEGLLGMKEPIVFGVPFIDSRGMTLKEFTIELKHEEKSQDIMLLKKDKESDQGLEGAVFHLFKLENDKYVRVGEDKELISDKEGRVIIKGFRPGSYKIVEDKAPEGYQLTKEEILFDITEITQEPLVFTMYNEKIPKEIEKEEETEKEIPEETEKEIDEKIETKHEVKEEKKVEQREERKPMTNDEKNYLLFVGLGVLVLAGAGLYYIKKKDK